MSDHPAIAELATLPLFHRLAGRKALVVGGSAGAKWKAELLAAAGADVHLLGHEWTEADLVGAAIAGADIGDDDEALRFAEAARRAGAIVNLVDQPDLGDVLFGTIVNRSPVVIGILTDGASPMLGQSIRTRIESILPSAISAWAKAAKQWRQRVKQAFSDFNARRAFWQRFVAAAWAEHGRAPTAEDFDDLIEGTLAPSGSVTLVGAGPGDPELLTLKAVHALQSATVILHDHLVGPQVLELARREARRVAVGKIGRGPSCKQSDINQLMIELALAGERVVRLKGGDPMIFGRATDEIESCRAAGVKVSVIPGISAAQGAAAALLTSLTERKHARRLQFVTGHGADGKLPGDIDWLSVADRKVTTVLYMPRGTLDQFARKALAKGLDPTTPALAIASVSLPEETHVSGPVAEIGALAKGLPEGAPVTVIIGWVARRYVRTAPAVIPFPKVLAS